MRRRATRRKAGARVVCGVGLCLAAALAAGTALSGEAPDRALYLAAVEKLADRDWPGAVGEFDALLERHPDSSYAEASHFLAAKALLLGKEYEDALERYRRFLEAYPESRWEAKVRYLMADAYAGLARFRDAASIYRTRLEFLRGDAYRNRLSDLYLTIADQAYEGEEIQDPESLLPKMIRRHDWPRALEFYRKARSIRIRAERTDEVDLRIGRTLVELDKHAEAAAEFEALLKRGEEKALSPAIAGEATFWLARARWKLGDRTRAIEGFRAMEAKFADHPRTPEAVDLLGQVYLEESRGPGDEEFRRARFELAIATWERFATRYPENERAPQVRYRIGDAHAGWGDHRAAIAAWNVFLEKHPQEAQAPTAQFRIAESYLVLKDFDAATAAFKTFLGTYPNDARWTQAQEKVIETHYRKGLDRYEAKKVAEARPIWESFLGRYPLSAYCPEIYWRLWLAEETAERWEAGIALLRTIAGKYPESPHGPKSQLRIAQVREKELKDLDAAITEYEATVEKFPKSGEARQAAQVLATMRQKELVLQTPRVRVGDEPWQVTLATRNVPSVQFKAYRVDLEEYFRAKRALGGFEDIVVGIVEPTEKWTHEVADYGRYKRIEGEIALPLEGNGAYILTGEEETFIATTVVVRSDLSLVVKESPRQTLVFAKNERTGEPWEGVEILLADAGGVFAEGKTGSGGVWIQEHDKVRQDVRVLGRVVREDPGDRHYAFAGARVGSEFTYGYTTKAYIYTDRPIYRPLQTVRWRGIVRRVEDGAYATTAGEKVKVSITNPLGVVLWEEERTTNDFGTVSGELALTEEPPLGEYVIRLRVREKDYEGKFAVEEYKKPAFSVALDLEQGSYLEGETAEGVIRAKYYFGAPVGAAEVRWRIFGGPFQYQAPRADEYAWFFAKREGEAKREPSMEFLAEGTGRTDDKGELAFRWEPPVTGADRQYIVSIEVRDVSLRWVSSARRVLVTRQGVYISAKADKKLYRPGERITVRFRATDAEGTPVAIQGEVVAAKRRREADHWFEEEVRRFALAAEEGLAEAQLTLTEPGEYAVLYEAKDRRGTAVRGRALVRIAGEERDLAKEAKLLAEREIYHRGETAQVMVNTPEAGVWALLTFEGERVLDHKVLKLEQKSQMLALPMKDIYAPNVTIAIAIPHRTQVWTASDEVLVFKYMKVEVTVPEGPHAPGAKVPVEIRATDQGGRPVEAELSLAVVDESIFALRSEYAEAIKAFFYDQTRRLSVETASSFTFRYAGRTRPLSAEVLAEYARMQIAQHGRDKGGEVITALADLEMNGRFEPPAYDPTLKRDMKRTPQLERVLEESEEAIVDQAGTRSARARGAFKAKAEGKDAEYFDAFGVIAEGEAVGGRLFRGYAPSLPLDPGAGPPALVPPKIRRKFADTCFWAPEVRTDRDGRATVEIEVPDNLTTWRATALGTTKETLVGDGRGSFRVSKDLLVRYDGARFLTQGDEVTAITPIHNYLDEEKAVRAEIETEGVALAGPAATTVRVPAGGVATAAWPLRAPAPGGAAVTVKALTDVESDALGRPLPVLAFGEPHDGGASGILVDSALLEVEIPDETVAGTEGFVIVLYPHVEASLLDAVRFLETFPYGCVEQTVNGFLPAIALADALEKLGVPDEGLKERLREEVRRRIVRLLNYQSTKHWGWAWWQGNADPTMTAYALFALEKSRLAGFRVQTDRLERARQAAAGLIKTARTNDEAALLLFALSHGRAAPADELNRIFRFRDSLSPYGLALLALAMQGQGFQGQAGDLVAMLRAQLVREGGMAHAPDAAGPATPRRALRIAPGGWFRDSLEATAWALAALDAVTPGDPVASEAAAWLLTRRKGPHWGTTKATGAAVMALAEHYRSKKIASTDYAVRVVVNGKLHETIQVRRAGDPRPVLSIPLETLRRGRNRIRLEKSGGTEVAYAFRWAYFTPAEVIEPAGNLLRVTRAYLEYKPPQPKGQAAETAVPGWTIVREEFRPEMPERTVETIESGEKVRVRLRIEARESVEYVLLEDPLPAGCEVDAEGFEGTFDRKEIRDEKVVFFLSRLEKGTHELSYLLVPIHPGRFRALAARVAPMYEPEIHGRSGHGALRILGPEEAMPPVPVELTADEIFFDAEKLYREKEYEKARPLYEKLVETWKLQDGVHDQILGRLVGIDLELGDAPAAVKAYEELARRNPRLAAGLPVVWELGQAYETVREYERALEAYKRLVDEAYLADRGVVETYFRLELPLKAQDHHLTLLAQYPDSNRIIADWFQLAKKYTAMTPKEEDKEKKKLPGAEEHKPMYREAVLEFRHFIQQFPASPWAPQAQHLVVTCLENLGAHALAVGEARAFARRYPDSPLLDDVLFAAVRSQFAQGEYEEVLSLGREITETEYLADDGKKKPSPHRDPVTLLMAKARHIRGEYREAVALYRKVAEKFEDARDSLAHFTQEVLTAPEIVSLVPGEKAKLEVTSKNLKELELMVYRVDLPMLFATRKDLKAVASVDLTGIEPVKEWKAPLVDPGDYRSHEAAIDLPVSEKGAYLVVGRAKGHEIAAVVVASDIEIRTQRVGDKLRVYVETKADAKPVAGAYVKISDGKRIVARGETDARGVFEGRGIGRPASVLADQEGHYAIGRE